MIELEHPLVAKESIGAMHSQIKMIEDPRLLVYHLTTVLPVFDKNFIISLDAIFVPFRNRHTYVNNLLNELLWYEGPIYLMPSCQSDLRSVNWAPLQRVEQLSVEYGDFISFFESLLTSTQMSTRPFGLQWDLPLKRNYALWYSKKRKYRKILLVDDDIRGLVASTLYLGSSCLDNYSIAGCFVEEFPDASIVDHLELLSGKNVYPFLSGSFLFVRPSDSLSFFPKIYNEDWIFMIHHIIGRRICAFGSIRQMPYDPFQDINKAAFQEFGEIITEGLYALLNTGQYHRRFERSIWEDVICQRRQTIASLKQTLCDSKCERIVAAALDANRAVVPDDCLLFIENWESDLVTWQSFIMET